MKIAYLYIPSRRRWNKKRGTRIKVFPHPGNANRFLVKMTNRGRNPKIIEN